MNSVNITGYLATDPEASTTKNGTTTTRFRLGTDNRRDRDGDSFFFTITAYGKTAEAVNQYLEKGRLVAVTGSLNHRSWKDDEDRAREIVEIVGDQIDFLPSGQRRSDSDDGADS